MKTMGLTRLTLVAHGNSQHRGGDAGLWRGGCAGAGYAVRQPARSPGRCQRGGGADQPPARNRHTTAHPRQACPSLLARRRRRAGGAGVCNETFGLSIEEVELCNVLVTIPGNPAYFSLNLAQAVQVLAYELFSHTGQDLDALRPE